MFRRTQKLRSKLLGSIKHEVFYPKGSNSADCRRQPSERVQHTIHKGYKFATTIADLPHHRVYDVIKGKRHIDIEGTLMSYKGRGNVKVVCMELSSGYRSIVRRCYPNAKILADRFHVISLVLYHFMEF